MNSCELQEMLKQVDYPQGLILIPHINGFIFLLGMPRVIELISEGIGAIIGGGH